MTKCHITNSLLHVGDPNMDAYVLHTLLAQWIHHSARLSEFLYSTENFMLIIE